MGLLSKIHSFLRQIGQGFLGLGIAISSFAFMILVFVVGILLLTSIFWLPWIVLGKGLDFIINLVPIRRIVRTGYRVMGSGRWIAANPLFTLILLLPGAVIAYGGFVIHRRHIQIIGFLTAFLTTALLGVTIEFNGILLLLIALIMGLVGAKLALAIEVAIALILGFLFTAIISAFLLGQSLTNPIILFIGIIGAVIAWYGQAYMILLGTVATGAGWMTMVAIASSGASIQNIAFAPLSATFLFLYLIITAAGVQSVLVEEILGPIDYIKGGTGLNKNSTNPENKDDAEKISDQKDSRHLKDLKNQDSPFLVAIGLVGIFILFISFPSLSMFILVVGGIGAGAWRLYGNYDNDRREELGKSTPSPHLEKQDELISKLLQRLDLDVNEELSEIQTALLFAVVVVLALAVFQPVWLIILGSLFLTGGIMTLIEWMADLDTEVAQAS